MVDQWIEEVASDIEKGSATQALSTRHMRGVLAFAQPGRVARSWAPGRVRGELDRMIDVLTGSWWRLLSDGG